MRFAGLVDASYQAAERVRQDNADEATKLATAKTKAMEAARAARTAADSARMEANAAAAALGATSMLAIEADAAADAAEAAATAAEEASARAQLDTTSADAIGEQDTAESKQREAVMKLAEARSLKRDALLAKENSDRALIVTYREQAMDAKDEAATAAAKARDYATKADAAADEAEEAARHAKAAKTDYAEANKQAMAARAAATAADTAAGLAEDAAELAEAESDKANADGISVEDALAARNMARAERTKAMTQRDTAMARYDSDDEDAMGAKQLAAAAKAAAGTFELKLLAYASGQGLEAEAKKTRVQAVAGWIAGTGTGDNDTPDDTTDDNTHAVVSGDSAQSLALVATGDANANNSVQGLTRLNAAATAEAAATDLKGAVVVDKIGTGEGKDRVYHFGGGEGADGSAVSLMTGGGADTTTDATDDVTQMSLGMLGVFTGVELSKGMQFAHIYTDYDESKNTPERKAGSISGVAASTGTVSGTFDLSTAGTITVITTGDMESKFTVGGVTYSGTGLTFTCATATADCSYTSTGPNATATITSLGSGWRVSGNADAADEMGDPDYLTFGIWLYNHDTDDATDGIQAAMQVGAFASGNKPFAWADAAALQALTGTATYTGSAAGLHSKSGATNSVNPFDAKAELKAEFGAADAEGMIGGRIYDIVSGGEDLAGDITLAKQALEFDGSGIDGNTRMGTATVDPSDGTASFPYNGQWDYRFFGDAADVTDVAKRYPGSVAGTFSLTGTDDMGTMNDGDDDVTQSFIGAFGAHRQ